MTHDRTRQYAWQDPLPSAAAGMTLSGIDYLRAMIAGQLAPPPIAATLDYTLDEVSEGKAIFSCEPKEFHYNPIGVVHGGLAATLLDSAMACSIHTLLPTGVGYTTIELHLNYVRPLTSTTGRVQAIGEVIHSGRSIATAQGRLVDASGKLYAHGSTTCLIMRPG